MIIDIWEVLGLQIRYRPLNSDTLRCRTLPATRHYSMDGCNLGVGTKQSCLYAYVGVQLLYVATIA